MREMASEKRKSKPGCLNLEVFFNYEVLFLPSFGFDPSLQNECIGLFVIFFSHAHQQLGRLGLRLPILVISFFSLDDFTDQGNYTHILVDAYFSNFMFT